MQAVILAAGKSTRTQPLTNDTPKPLLKILDKHLIDYTFETLSGIIDEAILIVGFRKEMLMDYLGDEFKGIRVRFIEQKEQKGTGHALMLAKEFVKGKFIVLNGDDLYSSKDIKRICKNDYCVLGQEVPDPENYGIFKEENGFLKEIVEKPKEFISNFANIGVYVTDKEIFDCELCITERGELEATDMITNLAKKRKVKVEKVEDYWKPLSYPKHYFQANIFMLKKQNISKFIGENCNIENNSKIEGSIVMDNVTIKENVLIKNSLILDNVEVSENKENKIVGKDFEINL